MKKFWFIVSLLFISCITFVKANYSEEYSEAYTWAYNNGITTMTSIDKANMNWEITRIALAKMISNFSLNVLKKNKHFNYEPKFDDVSTELNKQYDNWATNAYQLELMWQWISKFRPYDKVTVAEFWTILSRLLYGNDYNYWKPYYQDHLTALYHAWIMSDISNPTWRNAIRGDIMTMLRKASVWGDYNKSIQAYKTEGYKFLYADNSKTKQNINWDKILYINNKYWFSIDLWKDMNWWYLNYTSTYNPFTSYSAFDWEDINSDEYKPRPFDWEQLIELYANDWRRYAIIYIYKKDKNSEYCSYAYENNNYCISIGVDMWVDVGMYINKVNTYEMK